MKISALYKNTAFARTIHSPKSPLSRKDSCSPLEKEGPGGVSQGSKGFFFCRTHEMHRKFLSEKLNSLLFYTSFLPLS
ncbi:hypothetical protein BIY37_11865 [Candidatus Brocadia sapporoensis]|uniref:Uncharacterized protein n=1 Tax=Candidatus Brocadia sapporoensis TaxID=392547 RepID=A0A1V6LXD3_9BACT|nr:hypothetical protein BIY37_11865 [Candidatus Brocadia sapporoensis]